MCGSQIRCPRVREPNPGGGQNSVVLIIAPHTGATGRMIIHPSPPYGQGLDGITLSGVYIFQRSSLLLSLPYSSFKSLPFMPVPMPITITTTTTTMTTTPRQRNRQVDRQEDIIDRHSHNPKLFCCHDHFKGSPIHVLLVSARNTTCDVISLSPSLSLFPPFVCIPLNVLMQPFVDLCLCVFECLEKHKYHVLCKDVMTKIGSLAADVVIFKRVFIWTQQAYAKHIIIPSAL